MTKTKLVVLFLLAMGAFAQETHLAPPVPITARPTQSRYWRFSLGILAAGNAIDTASSYGYGEGNWLLRSSDGRFEVRGLALKAGLVGAVAATEYVILRRTHSARLTHLLAWLNTNLGATAGAVGVHNYLVRNRGGALE